MILNNTRTEEMLMTETQVKTIDAAADVAPINVPQIETKSDAMIPYLKSALEKLQTLGAPHQKGVESELIEMLNTVISVDQPRIIQIGRALEYSATYNAVVRENVSDMHVSERFNQIADLFAGIREDGKHMLEQAKKEKLTTGDKWDNLVMRVTRGSTHHRFDEIRKDSTAVLHDAKTILQREETIIEGYQDFRLAYLQAGIFAANVMGKQKTILETAKKAWDAASDALTAYGDQKDEQTSQLEFKRAETKRAYDAEFKRYAFIKDVAETLKTGYNTSETLMTRLVQTHNAKDAVYQRFVTFFGTNETVLTTLDVLYTSQRSLHEITQTADKLMQGINDAINDIASEGSSDIEKKAVQVAYGQTIDPRAVQNLVDAIVALQMDTVQLTAKYMQEATDSTNQIGKIVSDGHERMRKAIDSYRAP
jgi:hypothetical protein